MAATLASRLADANAVYQTALSKAVDIIVTAPELYLYDGESAQQQAGDGRLLWSAQGGARRGARPFPGVSLRAAGSEKGMKCNQ
jgi:hypothetical protein